MRDPARLVTDEELTAAVRADKTLRKEIAIARERVDPLGLETQDRATIGQDEVADFLRDRL